MATTNFEGYSHEQLLAMIASLDPETVKARGTQLTQAAAAIKDIGESLKKHQVKGWEGEAARAFQEWVSRAGSATLLLSQYSEAGGKWMTEAAQTMVEVKANTPKYDTSAAQNLESARKYHNDPDAQQLGQTAHTKLTTDHAHAVQQLTKLAQSYEQSTTQMTRAQAPTFPPPPGRFEPKDPVNGSSDIGRASGVSGSYGLAAAGSAPSALGGAGSSNESGWVSGRPPSSDITLPPTGEPATLLPVIPDRSVDVDLDHVATLPDTKLSPILGLPGEPGPSTPGGSWGPPSGPLPPVSLPSTGGSVPITRPPVGIGGKGGGKVGGISLPPPRDSGIVGGRPISTGGPSAGIPRGTVIGADGQHAGGRALPGTLGGGGGPRSAPGGPATGRRLATEPGGVVGGRQVSAGGQPFTQGGSGLVRGPGMGAVGHGGSSLQAPSKRRGDQGGGRPDYLAEDEETWQGNRRVVPPVID